MTFSVFSKHLSDIDMTPSRNEMTTCLVSLFKEANQEEIQKVVYLALGQLAPLYANKEFGMAEKLVIRAIAISYETTDDSVKKLFKQSGDLGSVAESLSALNPKPYSLIPNLSSVFSSLTAIADASGTGSQEQKLALTAKLLNSLDPLGAKYAVRIILDKLRLGFSDKTVLDALSFMVSGDKSSREQIEAAYNVRPDVGWLAEIVKQNPHSPHFPSASWRTPHLGAPILPALCQRLPSTEEIIKKMGTVAVEPKWDGQRIQAHIQLSTVNSQLSTLNSQLSNISLFTRSLEDVTSMFPDLTDSLQKLISYPLNPKPYSLILDGEVVAFDPKTGKILPFQTMITRKRKYGVAEKVSEIPIRYMVFDILELNGTSLIQKPLHERRKILERVIASPAAGRGNLISQSDRHGLEKGLAMTVALAPQIITNNPTKIREFLKKQIDAGLEGIVTKQIDAPYSPGRTGYTWVKLKWEGEATSGGLLDTIDCVVMGTYAGRGKRNSFGLGAFLVGILSAPPAGGSPTSPISFQTIAKIGTGLTDEQWRKLQVTSDKLQVTSQPKEYDVPKELIPDVWMKPEIVAEIQADNLTKSPLHSAGYALRFPRLVRYRNDKKAEQATTIEEVKKLYNMQP